MKQQEITDYFHKIDLVYLGTDSIKLKGFNKIFLHHSLPNQMPCVLDILEVIPKPTEQPWFLRWEFNTQLLLNNSAFAG